MNIKIITFSFLLSAFFSSSSFAECSCMCEFDQSVEYCVSTYGEGSSGGDTCIDVAISELDICNYDRKIHPINRAKSLLKNDKTSNSLY